jgi:RNA polymerase-binding transcription factor DksA
MNEARHSKYYDKLQKRREQVEITLKHLNKERRALAENIDSMDSNAYQDRIKLLKRVSSWYHEETSAIEQAFVRLSEGRYGLCLECHKPIESHRLELYLDAEFCLDCMQFREY